MPEPHLGHLPENPRRALASPVVEVAVPVRQRGVRLTLTEKENTMAQYAVLIYAADAAHGENASPEELEMHGRHARELEDAGCMTAAFALESIATATSIRGDAVTDGPFLEGKEVVAGFYIIEAPDLDEALRVAGRNPVTRYGGGVEVRSVAGSFVRESVTR